MICNNDLGRCFARRRVVYWPPRDIDDRSYRIGEYLHSVIDYPCAEIAIECTSQACNDKVYKISADSFDMDGRAVRRTLTVLGVVELAQTVEIIEAEGPGGVGGLLKNNVTIQVAGFIEPPEIKPYEPPEKDEQLSQERWWQRYQMSGASDVYKDHIYQKKVEASQ